MPIIKFLKWICGLILSHSPVLHISSDSNFGSFNWNSDWRFSVLAISLGINKYYVLTFKKNEWKFYDRITLLTYLKSSDTHGVEDAAKRYETLLTSVNFSMENDDKVLERHKEYLRERTGDFRANHSNALNKINNYSAICIAYLAFLTFLATSVLKQQGNWGTTPRIVVVLLLLYAVYYFLNSALFLRFSLQVKGVVASKFSAIKMKTTDIVLAKAVYIDWMSSKNQMDDNATILLNVEKYLYSSIFFSIIAWVISSSTVSERLDVSSGLNTILNLAQVVEIAGCDGKVNMEQVSRAAAAFERKHVASVLYSKDNHLVDTVLPFLKNFTTNNSTQINYEIDLSDSDCKSIVILVKDEK